MNPLKKIYCRVFQTAFRIALPILPYREPKVLSEISDAVRELSELEVRSALLVTDPFLAATEHAMALADKLSEKGIALTVYDKTKPNPTSDNVEQARQMYIDGDCQAIIALGGGSPMDCAKAVGARIAHPKKSLARMGGILKVTKKIPPLFAIPTTAGTGSETTLAAVITDAQSKHKYAINSFPLIPSYAVLDASVTRSLPKNLTATTGMDALTHATEAFIGRSTTAQTRSYALEAVSLIFSNIERAYNDGDDLEARAAMLRASYLAGAAFSKSYVGYIHAVAHTLGGEYDTPHGLANAVLMPIVLKEYGDSAHKKLYKLALAAGVADENDSFAVAAEKYITAIERLNERMGIPSHLDVVKEEDIPRLARHADKEANPLYPVPKLMNAKELEIFYHRLSGGDRQ